MEKKERRKKKGGGGGGSFTACGLIYFRILTSPNFLPDVSLHIFQT